MTLVSQNMHTVFMNKLEDARKIHQILREILIFKFNTPLLTLYDSIRKSKGIIQNNNNQLYVIQNNNDQLLFPAISFCEF